MIFLLIFWIELPTSGPVALEHSRWSHQCSIWWRDVETIVTDLNSGVLDTLLGFCVLNCVCNVLLFSCSYVLITDVRERLTTRLNNGRNKIFWLAILVVSLSVADFLFFFQVTSMNFIDLLLSSSQTKSWQEFFSQGTVGYRGPFFDTKLLTVCW